MFKAIVTDAIISKGFEGASALRFSENKNAVSFRIGYRVYDKNAKDNHRYINMAVKAFGSVCERAEKMQLKESSRINIVGRNDEEQWDDKETGQKCNRHIIIAEEIEYASSDGAKTNGNGNGNGNGANKTDGAVSAPSVPNGQGQPTAQQNTPAAPAPQGGQTGMPSGFTGYENIDDGNPFFTGN